MELDPNRESSLSQIPIISTETANTLFEELQMQDVQPAESIMPQKLEDIVKDSFQRRVSEERRMKIQNAVVQLAENTYGDLVSINPDIVKSLNDIFKNQRSGLMNMDQDQYVTGMAIVLRTIHLETGMDFLYRLSQLKDESLDAFKTDIESELSREGNTILDRALNAPKIPETQTNLNGVISRISNVNDMMFGRNFETGAAAMYQSLTRAWESIYPPSTPSTVAD